MTRLFQVLKRMIVYQSEIGILNLLVSSSSDKLKNIIVWKKIKKDIMRNLFKYIVNKQVKMKQKICFVMSLTGYNVYRYFRKYCPKG